MRYIRIASAYTQSLQWRSKKCRPFTALMSEDADFVVITALQQLPFRCHADLVLMSLDELVSAARTFNSRLPDALQIDIDSRRTAIQIRNSLESILGYRRTAPAAMKVLPPIGSVTRKHQHSTIHLSPKTPQSPLAMKRSPPRVNISMLGRPKPSIQEDEADQSEIVMDSLASTRARKHAARSNTLNVQSRPHVPTPTRPYASVNSRAPATVGKQEPAFSYTTPKRAQRLSSTYRRHFNSSSSVSKPRSPRTPSMQITDMDVLVSTMLSLSASKPSTLVETEMEVGEFGVLRQ